MNEYITIPATTEELLDGLQGIDRLLTAKQWERAAIVYAWTTNSGKGRPVNEGNPAFTAVAFSELGIVGMKDRAQVRLYRNAWESAARASGQPDLVDVKPGDKVVLPDLPWKDHFGEPTGDVQERVARQVLTDPERGQRVIAEAVEKSPGVRDTVARAVAADPVTRDVVRSHIAQARDQHPAPVERDPLDPNELMRGIANAMNDLADNLARINAIAAEHPEVVRRVHEVTGVVGQRDYFRQAAEALLPVLSQTVGTFGRYIPAEVES